MENIRTPKSDPASAVREPTKPWIQRLLTGEGFSLPRKRQFWWGVHIERFLAFARKWGKKIPLDALAGEFLEFLLHDNAINRAVKVATAAAGISKPVSCHVFRHSFATHLLERAPASGCSGLREVRNTLQAGQVFTRDAFNACPKKSAKRTTSEAPGATISQRNGHP